MRLLDTYARPDSAALKREAKRLREAADAALKWIRYDADCPDAEPPETDISDPRGVIRRRALVLSLLDDALGTPNE